MVNGHRSFAVKHVEACSSALSVCDQTEWNQDKEGGGWGRFVQHGQARYSNNHDGYNCRNTAWRRDRIRRRYGVRATRISIHSSVELFIGHNLGIVGIPTRYTVGLDFQSIILRLRWLIVTGPRGSKGTGTHLQGSILILIVWHGFSVQAHYAGILKE